MVPRPLDTYFLREFAHRNGGELTQKACGSAQGGAAFALEVLEGAAETFVDGGPRLPADVDLGARRVERAAFDLARRGAVDSAPVAWCRSGAPSRRTAAAPIVSMPVPTFNTRPPPLSTERTNASTTSST